LPVWNAAGVATIVAGSARLVRRLREQGRLGTALCATPPRGNAIGRALRPHQWAKNLLIFVPLITSHRLLDLQLVAETLLAFVAFSVCASAIYVTNDLFDMHADRLHPQKCRRPFASGALSVPDGLIITTVLLVMGAGLVSLAGSWKLAGVLGVYVLASTAYSARLKREPVADVFVLAALYVLRVVAGGVATGIVISSWLLAFALFIFLSLAFVKRYTELIVQKGRMPGRGYEKEDGLWMHAVGTCAGYMAVLVLALYITSPDVIPLYRSPRVLWLLCPVLLFWIPKIWFRAGRGEMHHDPVLGALKDPMSYGCGAAMAAILLAAV
jgi:4-hydroxybenzoate polyprenyltransferase